MLTTWDTVSTLDRTLDEFMGSAFRTAKNSRAFSPAIDVRTSANDVVFQCDVPGVKQEDLEVTLEKHVLTIKGTRKFDGKENDQVMLGRGYGAFSRSFTLPDGLDDEHLTANLADGVLTVRIPKQSKAQPRKIQIGNRTSEQLKE
jgi:HSP20 family protein